MGGAYDLDELDEEWGPLLQQLDDLLMQVCTPSQGLGYSASYARSVACAAPEVVHWSPLLQQSSRCRACTPHPLLSRLYKRWLEKLFARVSCR